MEKQQKAIMEGAFCHTYFVFFFASLSALANITFFSLKFIHNITFFFLRSLIPSFVIIDRRLRRRTVYMHYEGRVCVFSHRNDSVCWLPRSSVLLFHFRYRIKDFISLDTFHNCHTPHMDGATILLSYRLYRYILSYSYIYVLFLFSLQLPLSFAAASRPSVGLSLLAFQTTTHVYINGIRTYKHQDRYV